jgi:hypothetical protein
MILKNHHKELLNRLTYSSRNHKSFTHGDVNSQLSIHYDRYLREMEQHGLVVSIEAKGDIMWHITNFGRVAIEGKKFKPSKDRICAGSMGGTYDGKELTRTCLRPGAYDYMDCPSLMAGYTRPFRGALV